MKKLTGKNILITGASGFLGTHLGNSCYENGGKLYGIDIRKPFDDKIWTAFSEKGLIAEDSELLFKENEFDIIFHLAGGASVGVSVNDPVGDFNNLLPPTLIFLTWIKKYCPNVHFVLFSSAAVYGNPDSLPIKETAVLHPLSPYGIHKVLAEDMLFHYSRYYNFRASVLRIFSAFGEGLRKQLFWDVMERYHKACTDLKDGVVGIELFGTGNESRDFIHGKDVAKAAILIATCELKNDHLNVFNVASGTEVEIKKAISYLFQNAEPAPKITFGGVNRTGDPERWQADISKLKSIGFESSGRIQDYLSDFYYWSIAIDKS